MHIETSRLVLLRTSVEILRADLEGGAALADALGIAVSPEWLIGASATSFAKRQHQP
jgi:hypothetical protein